MTPTPPTASVERTLIALDPSITCTGYAVFMLNGLVECGRITTRAEYQRNKVRHKVPAHERIDELIRDLGGVFDRLPASSEVVIEITSGKTSGRHGGGGAGLATYGMAVGHIVRYAIERFGEDRVHQVYENDWTRGKGGKDKRIAHCRYCYPMYAERFADMDTGGDIADAILLGDWWINNQRIRETA